MQLQKSDFKKKNVLIMGLGLHGGGVSVARWMVKAGAKVIVTDLKTKNQLIDSVNSLKPLNITYHLGGHQYNDFIQNDIIVQNPAVPKESKFLKIAQKAGVQIENEATLFFKLHNPQKILGITGTRGKSTTTTLIYELLKKKFKKIKLAGNIGTVPMFNVIDQIKGQNEVVLELSSWHLENLGDQKLCPNIAVVTNVMPDHLNRYKSFKEYIRAKENILRYQRYFDVAVLNRDNQHTKAMGKLVCGRRFWFSKKEFKNENGSFVKNKNIVFRLDGKETKVASVSAVKILGEHNIENVLAAVTVAKLLGVPKLQIKKVLSKFSGVESRLQFIKEINNIKYYNDTASTTPDATIAALKTIAKKKNIVLIAGGTDKKLKFENLAKEIKKNCHALVLLKGEGSKNIIPRLKKVKFKSLISEVSSMVEAVSIANSLAKKNDIVLLSPACASFNLFTNEFDRGDQFVNIVKKLK
ncbi:UDP-N-acetylmuramoyl-L-alanine--D-glutamate ligase [Patescibacteria group bacterium]|nr:UDP-N-acetylmuramoyl-L-alanine--D-glutamate ligase [Patescibacteria group bacterium]